MKKVLSCFSKKSSNGNNAALPISANTPLYYKQSASRLLLAVLFMLAAVQGMWGTDPYHLDDFDFGTPIVDENFNRLSETSTGSAANPTASLDGYGAFNYVYNGNASNTYAIAKNVSTTSFLSNCLALTQGSGSRLNVSLNPSPSSFGSVGVWRIKTTKTSRSQYGINTDMGGGISHSTARVYIQNLEGVIEISDGSSKWQSITTVNSDIIDICVIYNKSGGATTYGGGISISNNKAHVFINGVCVMSGENPQAFTISSSSLDNAVFRVVPSATSGYKSYVDDVQIWNSLPTAKTAHTQTYSVTLKDIDEVLTETSYDGGVTLPTREEDGFLGWSVDDCGDSWLAIDIDAHTEIIPAGTYYPSQNINLYPVYSNGSLSEYKISNGNYRNDWSGKYLISTGTYTATGAMTDNTYWLNVDGITPDTVTLEKTSREFTISKTGSYYYIQFSDGDYLTKNSDGTNMAKTAVANLNNNDFDKWDITSSKIIPVATNNRWIVYNSPAFKAYTSGTTAVTAKLYKRIESYRSLSPCTQHSITLSGSPAGTLTGGTIEASKSSACEGTTITITATPADSYEFVEWAINKEGGGTVNPISSTSSSTTFTMPDVNVTINATFATSAYEITLDKNGGDSDGLATVNDEDTEIAISLEPIRTGYTIEGYYTNAACTTKVATPAGALQNDGGEGITGWTDSDGKYIKEAGGTLYTNWEAKTSTVTLDNQDADGTDPVEDEVTATYDASMPAITATGTLYLPTKTGHTFQGYFDDLNGEGTQYYNSDGSSANNWDKEDDAVTLYAYWTPNITVITFDHQATTSAGTTEANATYGETPPAITLPEREGYVFYEYRTAAGKKEGYQIVKNNGSWVNVTDYVAGGKWVYTAGSTVTLYAQWNPVYSVDWRVDNIEYQVDNIVSGDKISSFPDSPSSLHESSDKEFAGWRTSPIDGVTDTDDASFIINDLPAVTSDRTYYAVFGNQKEGSVEKETVIWSENFSSYPNNAVPSGDDNTTNGEGRVVYNDGNVTYTCTNGYSTNTYIYSPDEDTQVLTIGADERDKGTSFGKWEISNLTTANATALMLTYYHKYNVKVTVTYLDDEDVKQSIIVGGGTNTSAAGTYSYIIDSRAYTTFSITFEATTRSGSQIDDVELKVYRPEMEKFVTNSYHNDLSSDEESPEAMNWSSAAWAKGVVPTINDTVVLSNVAMTVDVNNAKASKVILKDNSTLTISAGKALVVKDNIRKWDGENYVATEEEDIKLLSDGTNGTGALAVGEESTDTKATVQFYTKANANDGWVNQYFGIPVEETSGLAYYGAYLYEFDAEAFRWNNITSEKLQAFHPYRILRREKTTTTFEIGGTLVLPGTTTHKDKVLDLFRDEADYNEIDPSTDEPYNTINIYSNSWAAPIAITAFEDGDFVNVEKTIYIFNAGTVAQAEAQSSFGAKDDTPGQWLSLPISTVKDNPSTYLTVIPSQQAFLVYATEAPDEEGGHHLKLDYKKLVYDPAVAGTAAIVPNRAPRREADEEMEMMCLKVEGESGYRDRVMIHMRSDFSQGFDNGWDGSKIEGNATAPQMYAITEGGYMSVNCVPTAEGTVIAFKTGSEDSNYNFTFDYDGEEVWYLNDLQEQESTMIDAAHSYQFSSTTSDDKARFVISKSPIHKVTTGVEGTGNDPEVHKLLIEDKLFIIRGGHMYSADGALVK